VGNAVSQHSSLAGTRTGHNQKRWPAIFHGRPLLRVQPFNQLVGTIELVDAKEFCHD
jgi:hypothetical protein